MPSYTAATLLVSVIVSTRNRSRDLPACFGSIAAACAECPDIRAELVVVDNGSNDDTQEVTLRWAKSSGFPVTLTHEPVAGLSRARNCGIQAAKGNLIVFTDDDCRLRPDYIRNLVKHYTRDTELVMRGGRVELGDPKDLPITIKLDQEEVAYAHPMHPAGFLLGANMAMPREVINRLGWFDERFGAGTTFPGEDCDYIIRSNAAKIRVQYSPDLVVFHFHGRRDPNSAKRLFSGYMRANGALYIKHLASQPNLIKHFWWDIKFWFREMNGHQNALHSAGVGHRQVVFHSLEGMIRYPLQLIKDLLLNRRQRNDGPKRANIMDSSL